jgi:hypothetical protein
MTEKDVRRVLARVPRRPDGRIQVMASKFLEGKPLGPFRYYGTRNDDPNDIFPHQDRRELRGLRVFAAWLNHNDSDAANTLDLYVSEGGRRFVRHHLIDFGTTLGSGGFEPHSKRAGHEHYLEWTPTVKAALSFGLWDRPWRRVSYPDFPSIGRFEADYFDPAQWKPDYPHPAYDRMQPADASWAARIVARFTDQAIATIVRTGELTDPEAERYLLETLIRRRDKILRHYLSQTLPLDGFALDRESGKLRFEDLGVRGNVGSVVGYRYQWFAFNNDTGRLHSLTDEKTVDHAAIPVVDHPSAFLMVRIRRERSDQAIEVFLRNGAEKVVVGIDRH